MTDREIARELVAAARLLVGGAEKKVVQDAVRHFMKENYTTSEKSWEDQIFKNMKIRKVKDTGDVLTYQAESWYDPSSEEGFEEDENEVTFQVSVRDLSEDM